MKTTLSFLREAIVVCLIIAAAPIIAGFIFGMLVAFFKLGWSIWS